MGVHILLQQFYGLGVEAVKQPFVPRLGALVYDLGDWSLQQFLGASS
jgi:hypothetical protein